MKRTAPYVILLILPVIFSLFLYKHKSSYGEYFLSRNYDPSYPYLINSLNLAQFSGYGVGLINHPGTTVQELGAVVILIVHYFRSGTGDLVNDVIAEPEVYLYKIFLTFLLMYFSALLFLGICTFKTLWSLKTALFLQLTPFSFYAEDVLFQMTNICVEPLLVITLLVLIAVIIKYVHKSDINQNSLKCIILFGLLCGIGLATKISFFPVLIIPLLLIRQIKYRGLFLFISGVTFLLFVSPAFSISNISEFVTWIKDLVTHSGKYGTGNENIVETSYYIDNVKTIFTGNLIFSLSYILLLLLFILQFFKKFSTLIKTNKYYYLMTGILAAMTFQVLIVAKHFSFYYMIPVFMFSITGLYIANNILVSLFSEYFTNRSKYKYYTAAAALIISAIFIFQYKPVRKKISHIGNGRNEAHIILDSLEKSHKNDIVISTYECSSREFALYLGCFYAGTQRDRYMQIIKDKYPDSFYYNRWDNRFYEVWDENYIKTRLLNANKFYFQGFNDQVTADFMKKIIEMTNKNGASCEKIMTNYTGEAVYEITLE